MTVQIKIADITQQHVDAVVISASADLLSDHDIKGTIHKAAGPELADFINKQIPVNKTGNRLPVNPLDDRPHYYWYHITPGFNLPAKHIAHVMLPPEYDPVSRDIYHRDTWYVMSMLTGELRDKYDCKTVAVPAIAYDTYGYDPDLIAEILLDDRVHFGIDMTICLPDDPELHSIFQERNIS